MYKLFALSACIFSAAIVSIYSLSVPGIDKNTISFNSFKNKKILIVNTASSGNGTSQLAQLQQLYMQHKDSLVIIAFPSNSFGNEPRTNEALKELMQGSYGITFPIAARSHVKGDSTNVVYQWLCSKMQNDMMDSKIRRDYQKFLIDKEGYLVANFDSTISPLSAAVQTAIAN